MVHLIRLSLRYFISSIGFSTRNRHSFPKDTAAEQIAALHDEKYVTDHFWFHNALLACLAVTAFNLPKAEAGGKAKSK